MSDFFDLQVNGYAGIDFQQPDLCARDLLGAVREMNARAPTQFLFTLITDSVASLRSKLRRVEQLCREEPELNESLVGYHLEGPYLCSKEGFHGPHPRQFMKDPEIAEFDALHFAMFGDVNASAQWYLLSHGPDADHDAGPSVGGTPGLPGHITGDGVVAYDPTNGTISNGDLTLWGPGIGFSGS